MSNQQFHRAVIEFRQAVAERVNQIIEKLEFPCNAGQLLDYLRAAGFDVPPELLCEWLEREIVSRPIDGGFVSVHFWQAALAAHVRSCWAAGCWDQRKTPYRLQRERNPELTEAQGSAYDTLLLVQMLADAEERVEREAILEVVLDRLRLGPDFRLNQRNRVNAEDRIDA